MNQNLADVLLPIETALDAALAAALQAGTESLRTSGLERCEQGRQVRVNIAPCQVLLGSSQQTLSGLVS